MILLENFPHLPTVPYGLEAARYILHCPGRADSQPNCLRSTGVSVSISPPSATLPESASGAFKGHGDVGTTNGTVTWSASCGKISSASANPVTYTAPARALEAVR